MCENCEGKKRSEVERNAWLMMWPLCSFSSNRLHRLNSYCIETTHKYIYLCYHQTLSTLCVEIRPGRSYHTLFPQLASFLNCTKLCDCASLTASSYLLPCRRGVGESTPPCWRQQPGIRQKGLLSLAAIDTAWLVPVGSVERE